MKLFCMCQITGDVPKRAIDSAGFGPQDNQVYLAPNRYGFACDDDTLRPVILQHPMVRLKIGMSQMTSDESCRNQWSRTGDEVSADIDRLKNTRLAYPNVDLYRCDVCGAVIVVQP